MGELFSIFLSSVFVNNLMVRQYLGVSPYTLLCKSVDAALVMGAAISLVMTSSAVASWYVHTYLLKAFNVEYLYILAFVLVVLLMAYLAELLFKKALPAAYASLDCFDEETKRTTRTDTASAWSPAYLPAVATNCAVLGLVILNIRKGYGLAETVAHSLGASVGFTLVIVLLAGMMGRLHLNGENKYFQGIPEALIIASVLSIIFQLFVF